MDLNERMEAFAAELSALSRKHGVRVCIRDGDDDEDGALWIEELTDEQDQGHYGDIEAYAGELIWFISQAHEDSVRRKTHEWLEGLGASKKAGVSQ